MGHVFLVEDLLKGGHLFALKALRRTLLSEDGVERFKREFEAEELPPEPEEQT